MKSFPAILGAGLSGPIRFAGGLVLRAIARWRRISFVFLAAAGCGRLDMGPDNCFNVPVRGEGPGGLKIGSRNSFGFRLAPRSGRGQALLQARGPGSEIVIGDGNSFSNNVSIISARRVVIGNNCQIGDHVVIVDSDFHEISPVLRTTGPGPSKPVCIGNNVWLGSRVMVLKGVTIGDNSVVGAMSLVTKSIPSNRVAAGNPARIIREIE